MDSKDLVSQLASFIPVMAALITAIPLLITARTQRHADLPKSQAEAVSSLLASLKVMLDPLNERIQMQERENLRMRRIDHLQRELINTYTDMTSRQDMIITVLIQQLEAAQQNPVYRPNGEVEEFRRRLQSVNERLNALEACDDLDG